MIHTPSLLKEKRISLDLDFDQTATKTKIPAHFLRAIEELNYQALPEEPYLSLYLRRYATFLGLSPQKTLAFFRRDFIPSHARAKPRRSSFSLFITPRLTFFAVSFLALLLLFSYLFYQYHRFTSPPPLEVHWSSLLEVSQSPLEISGKTSKNSTVKINQEPVLVDNSGLFSTLIDLKPGENEIIVEAQSFQGKTNKLEKIYIYQP